MFESKTKIFENTEVRIGADILTYNGKCRKMAETSSLEALDERHSNLGAKVSPSPLLHIKGQP